MKSKFKSVVALTFAMVFGCAAFAYTETDYQETKTSKIKDVLISDYNDTYVIADATTESEWEPLMSDTNIATLSWESGHYVIKVAKAVRDGEGEGETRLILKSRKSDVKHLVFNVAVATLEMTKKVVNQDANAKTATIEVVTHYVKKRPPATAKTLFLGTACRSHVAGNSDAAKTAAMLKAITNAINGVATKTAVKYIFYGDSSDNGSGWGKVEGDVPAGGSLTGGKGGQIEGLEGKIKNGNHAAMSQFYTELSSVAKNKPEEYDYIVLEFDGNLLGGSESTHTKYADWYTANGAPAVTNVAKFLQKYYDLGRIIWIVNDWQAPGSSDYTGGKLTKIGNLDQLVDPDYFRPVQFAKGMISASTAGSNPGFWQGFLGLLNPDLYLKYDSIDFGTETEDYGTIVTNIAVNGQSSPVTITAQRGHPITGGIGNEEEVHWTTYNEADEIGNALAGMIKDFKTQAIVSDRVNGELDIKAVRFSQSSNNVEWTSKKLDAVTVSNSRSGNCVTGVVNGISKEWWTKLEIDVKDKGGFLVAKKEFWSSNSVDGVMWYYDPNVDAANAEACGPARTREYNLNRNSLYSETNAWTDAQHLWTNRVAKLGVRAENVTAVYNGQYTNIVTYVVTNEVTGATVPGAVISNSYDGVSGWTAHGSFLGFVNVTNAAPVYHQAFAPNYEPSAVGSATVTIKPAPIEPVNSGKDPTDPTKPYTYAPNIIRCYDGNGVNIEPATSNLVSGNVEGYLYSMNATGPFVAWGALQITNVVFDGSAVTSNKVYYTVATLNADGIANYYSATNFAYVTITQRCVTVTAPNKERMPTEPNPTVAKDECKVTPAGEPRVGNELIYSAAVDYAGPEQPGTYPGVVKLTGVQSQGNYWVDYVDGALTISNRIALKIFVADKTVTYGDSVPSDLWFKPTSERYECAELPVKTTKINGLGNVGFATTYKKNDPVGDGYSISTNSSALSSLYYNITVVPGKLTVKKAPIVPVAPGGDLPSAGKAYTYAPNIVTNYNGKGWNIEPVTVGVVVGNDRAYLFSTNATGPFVAWKNLQFTNVVYDATGEVASNKVWYTVKTSLSSGGQTYENYYSATNYAYVTILPAPIYEDQKGKKGPWAYATDVIVWTNDVPQVTKYGTNIVVKTGKWLKADDAAKVELGYTTTQPTEDFDDWRTYSELQSTLKTLCNTQVWCRVSCGGNYTPTNLTASVAILSRSVEVNDKKAAKEDQPLPDRRMEESLAPFAASITNNAQRADGSYPRASEPGWATNQLSGIVTLKFTSLTNLNDDVYKAVSKRMENLKKDDKYKTYKNLTLLGLDVDLVYHQTFSDFTKKETSVGKTNSKLVTFTIPSGQAGNLKLIDLVHDTGTAQVKMTRLSVGATPKQRDTYALSADGTSVTVCMTEFCPIIRVLGTLDTPRLTARLKWKYMAADNSFYAGIDVTCVGGDQTKIRNVCLYYEDRTDCYLRDPTFRSTAKLSGMTGCGETIGGRLFGKAYLGTAFDQLMRGSALNVTHRYGVSDATFANGKDRVQPAEMLLPLYHLNRIELIKNGGEAVLGDTLAYLTWQSTDSTDVYWYALGSKAVALNELQDGTFERNGGTLSPLNREEVDRWLAFGQHSAIASGSDPSLGIDFFDVSSNPFIGRVVTRVGDEACAPGSNARLTIMGATSPNGPYVDIASPTLSASGTFSFAKPAGYTFFKVRLEVVSVVE